MANTDKQNFRCDTEKLWKPFKAHVEALQEAGYDVDMSLILRTEVELVVSETVEQTAARLGLVRPSMQGKAKAMPVAESPEHTARRLRKLAAS
jgi:hypothetical protein